MLQLATPHYFMDMHLLEPKVFIENANSSLADWLEPPEYSTENLSEQHEHNNDFILHWSSRR